MLCKLVPEKCIACGLCQLKAPELFDYSDDGIVLFLEEPHEKSLVLRENQESAATAAYRKCPTRAILLEK